MIIFACKKRKTNNVASKTKSRKHSPTHQMINCFVCLFYLPLATFCPGSLHRTNVPDFPRLSHRADPTAIYHSGRITLHFTSLIPCSTVPHVLRAENMFLWVALILTVVARRSSSCPALCSCSFSPSGAEVECSRVSLTHFPEHDIPSNATRLSIQSTDLGIVTARHLSSVPLLTNLQLYHTNLTSLPSDLLEYLPRLHTLDLTGNRLARLPADVFASSLRSLVLKNNVLEEADSEWFGAGSQLTWLDLAGNLLTSVPAALLNKLPNLENLDLSDNRLQELQADHLSSLHRLETLNLGGNKLKSLPPGIFSHSPSLSNVFLHQNQLQELPGGLLQGLDHLQLLMLNQNQLQNLPTGLLDSRNANFQVALSQNPWVCDRRMEYLWEWLTSHRQRVIFLEEVTCAEPESLRNRQVVSVMRSERWLGEADN